MTLKCEQETILRWDEDKRALIIYTASPKVRRKLERLGYRMEVYHRDPRGNATGWSCGAPLEALTFRKLVDGQLPKRKGHRKGKLFQAKEHDELVVSEDQAQGGKGKGSPAPESVLEHDQLVAEIWSDGTSGVPAPDGV